MLSTDSGFSENVYFVAAQERITLVNQMLNTSTPDYVAVCYLSGVAVECLLHGYRMRNNVDDTAKHDLRLHAVISGFYDGMSSAERERMTSYLTEVVARWQNNHRYRSADALRRFIEKHRLYVVAGQQTTRQDVLRFNAERLVEAANQVVGIGVRRWTL